MDALPKDAQFMPFVPTLKEDDLAIVITVYEPDPDRWIDYVKSSRCNQ